MKRVDIPKFTRAFYHVITALQREVNNGRISNKLSHATTYYLEKITGIVFSIPLITSVILIFHSPSGSFSAVWIPKNP